MGFVVFRRIASMPSVTLPIAGTAPLAAPASCGDLCIYSDGTGPEVREGQGWIALTADVAIQAVPSAG
jgi:hypothetical protein